MFENPLSISRMAGPENFCLFGRDTEISENPSELHAEQNKSNVSIEFLLSWETNKPKKIIRTERKLLSFLYYMFLIKTSFGFTYKTWHILSA